MKKLIALCSALFLSACGSTNMVDQSPDTGPHQVLFNNPPNGPMLFKTFKQTNPRLINFTCEEMITGREDDIPGTLPIIYHGGPVMDAPINVYLIWYGNWKDNTAKIILPDFIKNLGGSPWWKTNTTYYSAPTITLDAGVSDTSDDTLIKNMSLSDIPITSRRFVSNQVNLMGQIEVGFTHGLVLVDDGIKAVIVDAISSGSLPSDPNAVYFVLTSKEVDQQSGWYAFCEAYCGWHDHFDVAGTDIKFSFVGDISKCPKDCAPNNGTVSPNNNVGADGMASVMAHELSEASSDPDLNSWYDLDGQESSDKGAWIFGTVQVMDNCAKYNMTLGERKYLIQQNWVNIGPGYCGMRIK